ncbi:helix-turn-helix domain-containing protein [Halomicrococcus sp. NG-SE-24]|uniref:helix-turn-helix domain-containing protein n=1 Tax=Halomicrococcus sp. NG-SE-24 TaxID=3436928 RepID=UPI003D97F28D
MVGETVYVELKISNPSTCQVAAASEPNATVTRVSRTMLPNDDGHVTEELEVEQSSGDEVAAAPVHRSNGVFRLQRPVGQGCACELVERYDCPVRSIHADDGELSLSFYAEELRTVRQVVTDLKESCDGVHIQRLYHADEGETRDLVYVDRDQFTDRQREVLRTAHKMGYFAYPKEANACEVAAALGITSTTFAEHLSNAQAKLLDHLLDQ